MTSTTAPGTTPRERIAYWRSLGWDRLEAMMTSDEVVGPAPVAGLTASEVRVKVTRP